MDTLHGRDGPGTGGRGRDGPARKARCRGTSFAATSPASDQPPSSSESVFPYATASEGGSTTPLTGLTDLFGVEGPGAPAYLSEWLPGGADVGWHDVDGIRLRLWVRREPDGGRLGKFIQDLLVDSDFRDPPQDDHSGLTGVREPLPVLPHTGDAAAAVAIPASRELIHV